jgi:hypothetical protein
MSALSHSRRAVRNPRISEPSPLGGIPKMAAGNQTNAERSCRSAVNCLMSDKVVSENVTSCRDGWSSHKKLKSNRLSLRSSSGRIAHSSKLQLLWFDFNCIIPSLPANLIGHSWDMRMYSIERGVGELNFHRLPKAHSIQNRECTPPFSPFRPGTPTQ